MLRKDTLSTIHSTLATRELVLPTREEMRAIERHARQLRAQAIRDSFRNGFAWLFRNRDADLPAGKIDAVHGH